MYIHVYTHTHTHTHIHTHTHTYTHTHLNSAVAVEHVILDLKVLPHDHADVLGLLQLMVPAAHVCICKYPPPHSSYLRSLRKHPPPHYLCLLPLHVCVCACHVCAYV